MGKKICTGPEEYDKVHLKSKPMVVRSQMHIAMMCYARQYHHERISGMIDPGDDTGCEQCGKIFKDWHEDGVFKSLENPKKCYICNNDLPF